MRRSQAPSILGAKASTSGVGGFNSPMLNKNKRSCRETSEKSLNVLQDRPDKMSFSEHESLIRSLLSKPFRVPLVDYVADCFMTKTLGMKKAAMKRAMHDPEMANALILYEPPFLSETAKLKVDPKDVLVHVVVDPVLGNILRPHQREGVKFMYDCLTGAKGGFKGCIMADEMGLGKTLQCITVVWTLLRQGPNCKPTINKAIIVCPSSLVKNWSSEFKKWLGFRINVLPIDGGGKEVITEKLVQFMAGHGRMGTPVLIISYETFRLYAQILHRSEVGMVLCDEGHRLKNCENQTYQALMGLKTDRRILISGTPIQNDLTEYFSLINFVNPGMLGSINEFRRLYENPILRGQDAGATDKEAEICEQSIIQLTTLVKQCMIRRTNTILTKYLPMKFEMIICVRMSGLQEELYENYLRSDVVKKSMKEMGNQSSVNLNVLGSIISLKKLCSHPDLVMDKIQERSDGFENAHKIMPTGYSTKDFHPEYGSKVMLLDVMLASIKANTDDKVVFISNYTGTLDFIQKLCVKRGYGYIRLDGSITIKNRLKLVDEFNATDQSKFLFLLSSKAGGCGLNLIGANRLIMFDPDWNPANDDQAMARVWRDGQKKTCYIYRMLVTGSIEEKIFQRQTQKKMLSNSVVDNEEDVSYHFSRNDLKELFLYEKGILSDTHNKIKCKRCVRNIQTEPPPPDTDCTSEIAQWYHSSVNKDLPDKVLSQAWNVLKPNISFIFHHHSSTKFKDESSMKQEIEKTVEQLSQNSQKLRNYESDYEDECDEYDKDFVP